MPLVAVSVAVVVLVAGLVAGLRTLAPATESPPEGGPSVVVRDNAGDVLASVPLPGRTFAVSYRNSIYGTLAEDRYTTLPGGRFRLVQIAADQRAVIEEYYAIPGPDRAAQSDRRTWVADPARRAVFDELSIAATDLGERTLRVPGRQPVKLWRLVEDNPIVVLDIEENP